MLLYSFDSDINLYYRFPMPQGLYCAEEIQRRKVLRRHLEQSSWIPPYFSISTSTLVLSLYCHHVSKSVNCSTRFKLLCVTLGWTSVWYWYYNSCHCSTTLAIMLSGCHGSEEVIHCTRGCKRKHIQMLRWKNVYFKHIFANEHINLLLILRNFVHEHVKCSTWSSIDGNLWAVVKQETKWNETGSHTQNIDSDCVIATEDHRILPWLCSTVKKLKNLGSEVLSKVVSQAIPLLQRLLFKGQAI